ncbi:MAG: four helix bundle protein [Acidobacteria bacterium]|nr:four helix bundle protein [Acidobacteriota bacterium]
MDAEELKKRTRSFALNIIALVQNLPNQSPTNIIARQLLSCGTSVGANYRAACRAKSGADFVAKLKIVEEECDEAMYWMELLQAIRFGNDVAIGVLREEANQILSIIVASIRTTRATIVNAKIVNRQS